VTDEPAGWQAGTDVGGSFTDVWLRTDDGREIVRKAPTTADVVTGLLEGLNAVAEAAGLRVWLSLGDRLRLVHGRDGWRVVTTGGALLCRGHTRWRTGATLRAMQLPEASGATLHRDLTVTASCCPATGALLGVDVHLAGTQPAHDLDLDLSPGGIADHLATKTAPAMHAHVNIIEEP